MNMLTGKQIQELREFLGWTRTKMGAELDVSESAVWRWEQGKVEPNGRAALIIHMDLLPKATQNGFKVQVNGNGHSNGNGSTKAKKRQPA